MEKFDCNREYNAKDHWNFKEILVNIIKVTLNSLTTIINIFSTDFAGKVY